MSFPPFSLMAFSFRSPDVGEGRIRSVAGPPRPRPCGALGSQKAEQAYLCPQGKRKSPVLRQAASSPEPHASSNRKEPEGLPEPRLPQRATAHGGVWAQASLLWPQSGGSLLIYTPVLCFVPFQGIPKAT